MLQMIARVAGFRGAIISPVTTMRTSLSSLEEQPSSTTTPHLRTEFPYAFCHSPANDIINKSDQHCESEKGEFVDSGSEKGEFVDYGLVTEDDSTQLSRGSLILEEPVLLSRDDICTVATSFQSDRGPNESILSDNVDNWDQDRIAAHHPCGSVWIQLHWLTCVIITRVVINWESAYATEYDLEVSTSKQNPWEIVHRSPSANMKDHKSWGVNWAGAPRHYEHDIPFPWHKHVIKALRLFVRKPATTDWGVSIWSIKVYGYMSNAVDQPIAMSAPMLLNGPLNVSTSLPSWSKPGFCPMQNVRMDEVREWHVDKEAFGKGLWWRFDFLHGPVLIVRIVIEWGEAKCCRYEIQFGKLDDWHVVHRFANDESSSELQDGIPVHTEHNMRIPLIHHPQTPTTSIRLWMHEMAPECSSITLRSIRVYGYNL